MKIFGFLFLTLFLSSNVFAQADKPKVVASASMFADMAKQIGGELIDVDMIVPVGGDPHLHEPTPRDAKLVSGADLILLNGLTFEGWINELVENSGTKASTIIITKGIDVIASQVYKNASDPHAWMDASNGVVYAENIANALIKLMPENFEEISNNLKGYVVKIKALDNYIKKEIEKIPAQHRVLITSHDAFAYYGRRYGLELEATIGISTEAEVQTSDIRRVTKIIKERNIPALFIESTINPKLIQQIAADAKVTIGGELFADSLDKEGELAGSYLGMLKHNTDVIVGALSKGISTTTFADEDKGKENSWVLYGGIFGLLALSLIFFIIKMNK